MAKKQKVTKGFVEELNSLLVNGRLPADLASVPRQPRKKPNK